MSNRRYQRPIKSTSKDEAEDPQRAKVCEFQEVKILIIDCVGSPGGDDGGDDGTWHFLNGY